MKRIDYSKLPIIGGIDGSGIHMSAKVNQECLKIAEQHYKNRNMETKTTVEDMTTLSPKEMATRLTEKHYAIIISGLKADGKKMQLVYGEKARKAALLTVQQILNVYGPDEWEAKGYFDLVEQEIEQMANWPYVNSQNK